MPELTPEQVFSQAAAVRDALQGSRARVFAEITKQSADEAEIDTRLDLWGSLLNAANREVDRAATLVLQATDDARAAAAQAIGAADDQLSKSLQDLSQIAETLKGIAQAVSLLGQGVKLLAP